MQLPNTSCTRKLQLRWARSCTSLNGSRHGLNAPVNHAHMARVLVLSSSLFRAHWYFQCKTRHVKLSQAVLNKGDNLTARHMVPRSAARKYLLAKSWAFTGHYKVLLIRVHLQERHYMGWHTTKEYLFFGMGLMQKWRYLNSFMGLER